MRGRTGSSRISGLCFWNLASLIFEVDLPSPAWIQKGLDKPRAANHIRLSVATCRRGAGVGVLMKVRRTILASSLLAAAVLSACARRQPIAEEPVPPPPADAVVLEVENHNWADVVLYVVHDGVHTRFAQIAGARNVSMKIPPQLQGQMGVIRIAARRIGGNDSFVSQAISLRGNSSVRFTIESSLGRSSVGVW